MIESILFSSDELLVRRIARGQGDSCFVTFDSFTDYPSLARPGFGQGYFEGRGIDAIHVLSRENRWYQHPELDHALAAIATATRPYPQVIAYGSSMGGFAALHYGHACGAGIGIALSPQFSIDPRVAPFEDRWAAEARAIRFRDDRTPALPVQYVVYDPRDALDRRHAALFGRRSPTREVRIPYGGHPVGSYLVETRCFEALLDGIRRGTLDTTALEADLRRCRSASGQYLYNLAFRTSERRPLLRLDLARRAVEANPGDPSYLSFLATTLDRLERHEEARVAHDRAVAMAGERLHILHNLVLHHEATGALAEARALAERLVATHPGRQMLRRSLDRIVARQRERHPFGRIFNRVRGWRPPPPGRP